MGHDGVFIEYSPVYQRTKRVKQSCSWSGQCCTSVIEPLLTVAEIGGTIMLCLQTNVVHICQISRLSFELFIYLFLFLTIECV